MKKYTILALAFSNLSAHAGNAVIPYWTVTASETACFSVSNISSSDVGFKVTLFDQNGSKYSGALLYPVNISALDQDTNLPAKSSASFCLQKNSSNKFGHGFITTSESSDEGAKNFVVANGRQVYSVNSAHSALIPINGGLPF
ncbi:hypothetical protein [Bowmanella dokdonensis]|uniref:Uncharacterized protein n=1 Tax=Bowmanella dokdonensis TaxID=751969 RepID=A0A939DLU4_9ALTE|nr:hypothetical protein [Bowmanella dokdonensis]MBN7824211.1 hypothetical protein [Bowmanella dokdonensis]